MVFGFEGMTFRIVSSEGRRNICRKMRSIFQKLIIKVDFVKEKPKVFQKVDEVFGEKCEAFFKSSRSEIFSSIAQW